MRKLVISGFSICTSILYDKNLFLVSGCALMRLFIFLILIIFRILKRTVGGFPRPLMDLSAKNFAKLIDSAFGYPLVPPFDPYHDSLSYMISCYVLPYMGLVAYVGTNPSLSGYYSKRVYYIKTLQSISIFFFLFSL